MTVARPIEQQIAEQHASEAAFLWQVRDAAVESPRYGLRDLCELDERVEAHLDGLRLAGNAGWSSAASALDGGEAGEIFVATVVGLHRGDRRGLAQVLAGSAPRPALARGFVSALGWAPWSATRAIAAELLFNQCPPELQRLGVAGCAAHRIDPGGALTRTARAEEPRLRARALRAAGECGRHDLLPLLRRSSTRTTRLVASQPGGQPCCWESRAVSSRSGSWPAGRVRSPAVPAIWRRAGSIRSLPLGGSSAC